MPKIKKGKQAALGKGIGTAAPKYLLRLKIKTNF